MSVLMSTFCVASFILAMMFSTSAVTHHHPATHRSRGHLHERPVMLSRYIREGRFRRGQKMAVAVPLQGNLRSYAGYFTVDENAGTNMFFWYIPPINDEVDPGTAPVILWLEGYASGVSSMFAGLFLNGPYRLEPDMSTLFNNHTWAKNAHLLYIDNPVGVGFSYTKNESGYSKTYDDIAHNLYETLIQFFQLFPGLRKNSLILAGDWLAGRYLTVLGHTIEKKNPFAYIKLNLQGFAIGGGFMDTWYNVDYGETLYRMGFIDEKVRDKFNSKRTEIRDTYWNMSPEGFKRAYDILDETILGERTHLPTLFKASTGLATYHNYVLMGEDVDSKSNEKLIEAFFNKKRNGMKLNAGKRHFRLKSQKVSDYFYPIYVKRLNNEWRPLMEKYRWLYYNGQFDLKSGIVEIEVFLWYDYSYGFAWNGYQSFKNADRKPLMIDGEVAGNVRTDGKHTTILVRNAGHFVPRDQAKWAAHIIKTFANNGSF